MSNYLAIATVTAALQTKLIKAAEVVDEAVVTTSRPNGNDGAVTPAINIFLYQVIPNAAYRNCDLPTRRSNGHLAQRPQAALTLHYLLSFSATTTSRAAALARRSSAPIARPTAYHPSGYRRHDQ